MPKKQPPFGFNPPAPNETQLRVNIGDTTDVTCDRCGDLRFEPVWLIKKLSRLLSPTGKDEIIPIGPLFACVKCGHINEMFLPQNAKNPSPETPKENDHRVESNLGMVDGDEPPAGSTVDSSDEKPTLRLVKDEE